MGLLNLIDHNQYITGNFIRKMRANTERAKRIGEEFRSLTDMITYSGGSVSVKGTAFSAVGNAEVQNTDGTKENSPIPEQDELLYYFENSNSEKINEERLIAIRLLDTQIYNNLEITDLAERQRIIQTILENKPYMLDNLYILNLKSGVDYQKQMSHVLQYVNYDNYVNAVSAVGDWYASNIPTYYSLDADRYKEVLDIQADLRAQGINSTSPEWVSATTYGGGRKDYECKLDGNLSDLTVYDDCSSFVTACLIQGGILEQNTRMFNSADYQEGKEAAQALMKKSFNPPHLRWGNRQSRSVTQSTKNLLCYNDIGFAGHIKA